MKYFYVIFSVEISDNITVTLLLSFNWLVYICTVYLLINLSLLKKMLHAWGYFQLANVQPIPIIIKKF